MLAILARNAIAARKDQIETRRMVQQLRMQVDDQLNSLAGSFAGLRAILSQSAAGDGDRSPGLHSMHRGGILRHRRSIVQMGGGVTASPAGRSALAPIHGGDDDSTTGSGAEIAIDGALAAGSLSSSRRFLMAAGAASAALVGRTGIVVSPALSQMAF